MLLTKDYKALNSANILVTHLKETAGAQTVQQTSHTRLKHHEDKNKKVVPFSSPVEDRTLLCAAYLTLT